MYKQLGYISYVKTKQLGGYATIYRLVLMNAFINFKTVKYVQKITFHRTFIRVYICML